MLEKPFDIITLGPSFYDLIVPVTPEVIRSNNIPLGGSADYLSDERCKEIAQGSTTTGTCGGAEMNTLTGIAALGATCGYIGVIGTDEIGGRVKLNLEQRGITALYKAPQRIELTNPVCYIFTYGHERSFVAHENDSDAIQPEDLPSHIHHMTNTLFCGFKNYRTMDQVRTYEEVLIAAKENGLEIVFTMQAMDKEQVQSEPFHYLRDNYATTILGNEMEIPLVVDSLGDIPENDKKLYVMTKGAHGVSVRQGDGQVYEYSTKPLHNIIDSIGAGDQFAAGFVLGKIRGMSLDHCVELGQRCARAILLVEGGQPPLGTSWQNLIPR
jgi:sugar/nucleoside kinase (ribokinase family)